MELSIIGATGRTGFRVVRTAVEAGHTVRAIVRNRGKLEAMLATSGDRSAAGAVEIVEADLLDREAARAALAGRRVVIYAAGPVKGAAPDMPLRAAQSIIAAMKAGAGEKLVWLTGAGVVDERDGKSGSRAVVRGIMKLVAGKVLKASEDAYELVKHSGLTYVVVRPPMLSEQAGGTGMTANYTPPKPIPLGRDDLAAFLVEAAATTRHDNESPFVSYRDKGRAGA